MPAKQLNITNTSKTDQGIFFSPHSRSGTNGLSPSLSKSKKESESQLLAKLHSLENLNAHLEKLLRKQTKELAENTNSNRKFLSIIAHDLRSPFSSILGVLELIRDNLKKHETDELENYISIASESANNTLNLLDSLLSWSVSQNNIDKSFNPENLKLIELVKEECVNMCPLARYKHITLTWPEAADLIVIADRHMVRTILRNLISNAIKYTNIGGKIEITFSENPRWTEISVNDNGIGMPEEIRKDLFKIEKFHSTYGTLNEKGTGLGLLLCKEFVELHGGKIEAESEPEKGSKFTFTLPHPL